MAVVAAVVAKSMAVVATVQQVGISSSLGLSLGLPLSVVGQSMAIVAKSSIAKVSKSVAVAIQVGLSLGLSLSLPLAIVVAPVAQTMVAETISVVAKTAASVEEIGVSLCLGFRLSGSDGHESENYEQFHVECRMSRSKLCSPC